MNTDPQQSEWLAGSANFLRAERNSSWSFAPTILPPDAHQRQRADAIRRRASSELDAICIRLYGRSAA